MKLVASSSEQLLPSLTKECIPVLLYGRGKPAKMATAGAALVEDLRKHHVRPDPMAWDLVSFALSVIVADTAVLRSKSPDGWTRELDLTVGVTDPEFWNAQKRLLECMLQFLTTDRWSLTFEKDCFSFVAKKVEAPDAPCIALLSGGIDSLVGTLDLVAKGVKPLVVSQIVLGDGEKQSLFAKEVGGGLRHFQLNHNAACSGENERSQRSRSLIFLAYGTLAATSLRSYGKGDAIPLYVCENGFISINPPLTEARLGSLSTRTTHPVFIDQFQELLKNAGLGVALENPYRVKTKGEMLLECSDQAYLRKRAHEATSCGRYRRNGLKHCGRCIPCMVRRASFAAWKVPDKTDYIYKHLGTDDADHARYNDVRSAVLAIATAEAEGLDALLGASLSSDRIKNKTEYRDVVERGLNELKCFLKGLKVL